MNKKLTTLSLLIAAVFLIAGTSGHLRWSGQPPAEKTGAPGENTCGESGCHSITPNLGAGSINLQSPDLDSLYYFTDSTYRFTVTVNNPNQDTFGFEITALDVNDNRAGDFSRINTNNTALQTANSRQYISHKNADGNNQWQFDWTAPSNNVDTITFYVAGNAANGDGGSTGDTVYTNTLSLAVHPDDTSDTVSTRPSSPVLSSFRVYPNPASRIVYMDVRQAKNPISKVTMLTIGGERVKQIVPTSANGKSRLKMELPDHLSGGVYLIRARAENGKTAHRKIVIDN